MRTAGGLFLHRCLPIRAEPQLKCSECCKRHLPFYRLGFLWLVLLVDAARPTVQESSTVRIHQAGRCAGTAARLPAGSARRDGGHHKDTTNEVCPFHRRRRNKREENESKYVLKVLQSPSVTDVTGELERSHGKGGFQLALSACAAQAPNRTFYKYMNPKM